MSKTMFRTLAAFGLCTVMMTGSAWAQGRGHARGNMSNQTWRADRDGDRNTWNRDWRGDRDRWTFGNDQRPSGWNKGKKTGWGNCDVPPGQAKKMGCNPVSSYYGRSHSNYRDRDRDRDRVRRHR